MRTTAWLTSLYRTFEVGEINSNLSEPGSFLSSFGCIVSWMLNRRACVWTHLRMEYSYQHCRLTVCSFSTSLPEDESSKMVVVEGNI